MWNGTADDLSSILEEDLAPLPFDNHNDMMFHEESGDEQDQEIPLGQDSTEFNAVEFQKLVGSMHNQKVVVAMHSGGGDVKSGSSTMKDEVSIANCVQNSNEIVPAVNVDIKCEYETELAPRPNKHSLLSKKIVQRTAGNNDISNVKCRMFQKSINEQQGQTLIQPIDEEVSATAHIPCVSHSIAPVHSKFAPLSLDTISSSSIAPQLLTPQQMDKNRRNAIIAKNNREKKKIMFAELERENSQLKSAIKQLVEQRNSDAMKIRDLEDDNGYYRDVLETQSEIAGYLDNFTKNTGKTPCVGLNNKLFKRKVAGRVNEDHDYECPPKRQSLRNKQSVTSGGVCMHISKGNDNVRVTLETCRDCAHNAAK